jgi:hypothetical protein
MEMKEFVHTWKYCSNYYLGKISLENNSVTPLPESYLYKQSVYRGDKKAAAVSFSLSQWEKIDIPISLSF